MSLLGTLGGIAGGLAGFATGGIGGAIAGFKGGTSLFSGGGGSAPLPSLPTMAPQSTGGIFGGGGILPGVFGPGGTLSHYLDPQGNIQGASGGQCPRGYHLNKHALSASKRHGALPARSICVRNRHLNPMNPRALSRALRREKRARKIVRRLHVFAPVRHQKLLPRKR